MAPEMIQNDSHDHRLDIWCLGILLYEMLHGHAPFRVLSKPQAAPKLDFSAIKFKPDVSPLAQDLITRILKREPRERLTMAEIFDHPWMQEQARILGTDIWSYVYASNPKKESLLDQSLSFDQSFDNKRGDAKLMKNQTIDSSFEVTPKSSDNNSRSKSQNTNSTAKKGGQFGSGQSYASTPQTHHPYQMPGKSNQTSYYDKTTNSKRSPLRNEYLGPDDYFPDGNQRISRVSERNERVHSKYTEGIRRKREESFFDFLFGKCSCFRRDTD
eukprot:TRINITY_DN2360_c0_g1_i1.p1 TRINITY_DN2360_c0_g1~~TRINITY_DN2360_c0_g1_i1.p1  ORF type:complete len:271 (+),score=42.44 TRINITY_DN2360_c0_g1_i1:723-1535(+)